MLNSPGMNILLIIMIIEFYINIQRFLKSHEDTYRIKGKYCRSRKEVSIILLKYVLIINIPTAL